jgi:hypothetical protein
MFRKKILLAVFLVLALSLLASAVHADGLTRVTGSAYYHNEETDTYWTDTISAIEHADGRVSGQVQVTLHGNPIANAHIAVDCLRVLKNPYGEGYIAFISGWLTHAVTPSPLPPNLGYATIAVLDGGEGPEAVDYITSSTRVSGPEIWNCETPYSPGPPWEVINGEIQVNP